MMHQSAWLEDSSKSSAAEATGNTALLEKAAKRIVEAETKLLAASKAGASEEEADSKMKD